MRKFIVVVAFLSLAACSTRTARQAEERSDDFAKQLRLGMSKADVEKLGVTVGNCRGQPTSLMSCEAVFDLNRSKVSPYQIQEVQPIQHEVSTRPMPKVERLYDVYKLDFEKDRLKLWTRQTTMPSQP